MHGHLTIKTHIFLTGATGYIGGSVLAGLLQHPLSDTFRISILVRDAAKASQFRTMGMHAILGSYSDLKLLQESAADADLVIACADADDGDAAKAILRGLQQRYEKSGKIPSLLHTSGTGVLVDNAQGMKATDTIYSDLNIHQLESLPITQPHRSVAVDIVNADNEGNVHSVLNLISAIESRKGYVKTYIVLPSTIYGIATGPLVDAGLQNAHSQQIPTLVKLSLDRGRAGMIGQGKNIWPNVHIHDVTDLYILIIENIIPHRSPSHVQASKPKAPPQQFEHGRAGFYFGENGEHTLYDVGAEIGKAMVARGKSKESEPTSFTEEEMEKYFPQGTSLGTNSRCRADRGRAIGWKPKKTTKDMLASVKHEFQH